MARLFGVAGTAAAVLHVKCAGKALTEVRERLLRLCWRVGRWRCIFCLRLCFPCPISRTTWHWLICTNLLRNRLQWRTAVV